MSRFALLAGLLVATVAACQPSAPPAAKEPADKPLGASLKSPVVRVKVTTSGEIVADGKPVTVDDLALKLAELKQAAGEVWYHRENSGSEPHAHAMAVMELITCNQLPVKFAAKADFSESAQDVRLAPPPTP